MNETAPNPYLGPGMPLDQLKSDARAGVGLARAAWRIRDPEAAARELGAILLPGQEAQARRQRIIEAAGNYQRRKTRETRGKGKTR